MGIKKYNQIGQYLCSVLSYLFRGDGERNGRAGLINKNEIMNLDTERERKFIKRNFFENRIKDKKNYEAPSAQSVLLCVGAW